MRTRPTLTALAVLAAGALTLTGCGGSSDTTDPVTDASTPAAESTGSLTIWADVTRYQPVVDAAADFTAATGVEVEVVQRDYSKMQNDFISQAPTGNGPDIIIGGNDWTGKLVQNGVIAPIELGDNAGDYVDVAIEAVSYDGQVYGLPYAVENVGLFRNPALADSTPGTLDELIAKGQQLVDEGKAKYPFMVQQDPTGGDPYHLYPIQSSFGATIFATAADGTVDSSKVAMGGENGARFATYLADLGARGIITPNITADVAKQAFINGEVPYVISGPWNIEDFKAAIPDVAVDTIPSAGGEPSVALASVQAFFVSSYSNNQLAANQFLVNYVGTEDVQLALYEAGQRPPALKAAAESSTITGDPIMKGLAAVGATATPQPNVPAMSAVWTYWGPTQVAIESGTGGDPATVWQEGCDAIDAEIASAS
ncbi:MAG: maltose ABC transporter substrate-binding protein [Propionibacteriaceae bacterium]|jgi:arabinogalactan oligomer/maltooligosaccharide transport system substrate-binding protein|nr:maltose ABC transporter substrate-binding protein [Propionibacteriaceae bacterium]